MSTDQATGDGVDMKIPFAVVSDRIMTTCFILGLNFFKYVPLDIDLDRRVVTANDRSYNLVNSVRSLDTESEEIGLASCFNLTLLPKSVFISWEDILADQENSLRIRQLLRCLNDGNTVSELPRTLNIFKRTWKSLRVVNGVVVKKINE